MDAFAQSFFNEAFKIPGVGFEYDERPATWTFTVGSIVCTVDEQKQLKRERIFQPMTPAGKMELTTTALGTIPDGISARYLTSEGGMNYSTIGDTLKAQGGASSHEVSAYIAKAHSYPWIDNQVALLFNQLRYVMLARIAHARGNLDCRLGHFVQDRLNIDMDQYWSAEYPATCGWNSWPTQPRALTNPEVNAEGIVSRGHDYVLVKHTVENFVEEPHSALDLRGMTADGAFFTLAMLNEWTRRSRMRLDASLDKLTNTVYYRGVNVTQRYLDWAQGNGDRDLMSWEGAWDALRGYVTQNRLYAHFSTALYMVVSMMYQYVPETAEGIAWLDQTWNVSVPRFSSIRGRFPFFNVEEGAFMTQRPLQEWGWMGNQIERIHLVALVFAQCLYAGMAIRNMRKSFEMNPEDIHVSEYKYLNAEYFVTAAVTEFTRRPTPLSGLPGMTFTLGEYVDRPMRDRRVLTTVPADEDRPDALHTYVAVTARAAVTEDAEEDPTRWPDARPDKAEAIARMQALKRGARAMRDGNPTLELPREFDLALRDRVPGTRVRNAEQRVWALTAQILPMPGYPTFACPTQVMPYPSPYEEAGLVDPTIGELYPNGLFTKPSEAWRVLAMLNSLGYSASVDIRNPTVDATTFLKGRESHQIWPVLCQPGDCHGDFRIHSQIEGDDTNIVLPPVTNISFKQHKINYKFERRDRGVARGRGLGLVSVNDVGAPLYFRGTKVSNQVTLEQGTKHARAWFNRDAQDFQFVQDAVPGYIPTDPPRGDAKTAGDNQAAGGSSA